MDYTLGEHAQTPHTHQRFVISIHPLSDLLHVLREWAGEGSAKHLLMGTTNLDGMVKRVFEPLASLPGFASVKVVSGGTSGRCSEK